MDAHARGHAFYQESLTGVRALAAIWVALFHVNAFAGPRILVVEPFGVRIGLHPLLGGGWTGVTIFFVLSSFLLTTHMLTTLERDGDHRGMLPRYFVARVRRVIPAYWAQLAILFIVALAVAGTVPPWTRYVPLHLAMLHNVSEPASFSINSVYWTLPIEFAFYLLLPLVAVRLAARAGQRHRWLVLASVYLAAVAVSVSWRAFAFRIYPDNIPWISNQLAGTLDWFVLGSVLAAGWRWWRAGHPGEHGALSSVLVVAGLAGMVGMVYYIDAILDRFYGGHPALFVWYSINAAFAGVLVLGAAMGGPVARALFGNPVAVFLGTISYSLYLWHYPVVEWLRHAGLGYAAFFAVSFPLFIAASALSYRLFERPFLKPSRTA
jgi:peptidoglycan/LPS O-acetylase OafA/YrhL